MLDLFKIIIVLICVIVCTLCTPTKAPAFPICIDDVCHCGRDAHEEVYAGRKYCATNSKEQCPVHSVRLSKNHCECRKGYKFIDEARTICGKEVKVDLPHDIVNFDKSTHDPKQNTVNDWYQDGVTDGRVTTTQIRNKSKVRTTNKYQSKTDTKVEEDGFEPTTMKSVKNSLYTKAEEERRKSPIKTQYAVEEGNEQSTIKFDKSTTTTNAPKSTTNATQRNLGMNLLITISCICVLFMPR